MTAEKNDAFQIGKRLLSHVATAEERPRYVRGRVTEMFPYIYEAAKKMGIRAISRWLKDEGYAISPPTISRALAKSDEHLEELARQVAPQARQLVEAFRLPSYDFLFGPGTGPDGLNEYRELCIKCYEAHVATGVEEPDKAFERRSEFAIYSEPCENFLSRHWFVLSQETREHCRKYFTNIDSKRKENT